MGKYTDGPKNDYTSNPNATFGMGKRKPMATKPMSEVPSSSRGLEKPVGPGPVGPKTPGKIGTLINKAKEKANSLYNKSAGRTVSSVSKSFDGKEVQGKRVDVRNPGFIPSDIKRSKEVYKMPGGGKHVEKTKFNMKGDVVSKKVKDINVNPSNSSIQKVNRTENRISKKTSIIEGRISKLKNKLG
jgi:hypothetical protein